MHGSERLLAYVGIMKPCAPMERLQRFVTNDASAIYRQINHRSANTPAPFVSKIGVFEQFSRCYVVLWDQSVVAVATGEHQQRGQDRGELHRPKC